MKTSYVGPLPREGWLMLNFSIMLYLMMAFFSFARVFGGKSLRLEWPVLLGQPP